MGSAMLPCLAALALAVGLPLALVLALALGLILALALTAALPTAFASHGCAGQEEGKVDTVAPAAVGRSLEC